jgi:hypothetical protein
MLNNSAISSLPIDDFKNVIKNSKNWKEVMMYFKENHGYKIYHMDQLLKKDA